MSSYEYIPLPDVSLSKVVMLGRGADGMGPVIWFENGSRKQAKPKIMRPNRNVCLYPMPLEIRGNISSWGGKNIE